MTEHKDTLWANIYFHHRDNSFTMTQPLNSLERAKEARALHKDFEFVICVSFQYDAARLIAAKAKWLRENIGHIHGSKKENGVPGPGVQ